MADDATLQVDVLVVGAGNAGLCAALSALEAGARVLVLEKSPKLHRGGNTQYTAFYRFAYSGIGDLQRLCDIDPDLAARMNVESYGPEAFFDDLMRTSDGRADAEWMKTLAEDSYPTMQWLTEHGLKWDVSVEGAREQDDKLVWQPGTVIRPVEGGTEILRSLYAAINRLGGQVAYESALTDLIVDESGAISGGIVSRRDGLERVSAGAVVMAAGGFQASPERRARYLGSGWDVAKVRGSRFNTGECLDIAVRAGAASWGEWTGCHATMVHASAPDVEMGEEVLFPLSYPFGILINQAGKRFVDEGEHFYLHTYAKLGKLTLDQPGGRAFQVFDSKTAHLRHGEGAGELAYAVPHATADDLRELAVVADIDNPDRFVRTIEEYNDAVADGEFDPTKLDGKRTHGLKPDKSNWALPIDTPPFEAFPVECGITFTYGGLRSNENGQVLDSSGHPMRGLYVAGEMAGSFYKNYVGGTGLTKGAVFGRRAGRHAATSTS